MFLSKLLVLALVVWVVLRLIAPKRRRKTPGPASVARSGGVTPVALDLVRCALCETYGPVGAGCARPECPHLKGWRGRGPN